MEEERKKGGRKKDQGRMVVRYGVGDSHEILLLPTSCRTLLLDKHLRSHFLYLEWPADKEMFNVPN